MFSRQHRKTRPLFIVADILLIWLAFEAAYATRGRLPLERAFYLENSVKTLLIFACQLIWVLSGLWLGVYDTILRDRRRIALWNAFRQSVLGAAGVVFFQYAQRIDLSRPFIGLLFLYALAFLCILRLLTRLSAPAFFGADSSLRHLYVVGTGQTALRVGRLIEQSEPYGLRLLGFLGDSDGQVKLSRDYSISPLTRLPELLRTRVVDELVFAVTADKLPLMEETFLLCEEEGVRTRVHVDYFPHIHSRVGLERLEGEPMLTFAGAPHDEVRLLIKRVTDLAGASIALILLSPLLAVAALLVRLTSPGPILFRQVRCGLNGRKFSLYKFRTMVEDAEQQKAALEHLNVKKTNFKIPNDPRLTPLGKWLRKFSIDELPQLWNVLRGEMAIVGPRPAVPDEVDRYERWQRRRLRMRPGLTCLWALNGRDELDFDEVMRQDLAYIDQWSLSLDWSIILQTIPTVVLGKGAN
ncbi:sugar transferase [Paludibaculum fermentans]|uniref:Sugar transferase n=1 Tax=Paludibaculum fermentans TaxID=1473598 RepID=A0A7S7NJR3_PALFE|nr:sugar transferase [Paludibaculum fermentans]